MALLGLWLACSPQADPAPEPESELKSGLKSDRAETPASTATPTFEIAAEGAVEPHSLSAAPQGRTQDAPIRGWGPVEGLPERLALFDTVFWDPRDTVSLRALIAQTDLIRDKTVLEIGTGSGLISLFSLYYGAAKVVATDVNPNAIENARYNAKRLGLDDRLEVRQVSLDDTRAFSALGPSERFDLIISNPPWEDAVPTKISQYAFYDPSFVLLKSLLAELPERLNPGGKTLLAYGAREAILHILRLADESGYSSRVLDDRAPEDMPPVFLPGMLVEVTP